MAHAVTTAADNKGKMLHGMSFVALDTLRMHEKHGQRCPGTQGCTQAPTGSSEIHAKVRSPHTAGRRITDFGAFLPGGEMASPSQSCPFQDLQVPGSCNCSWPQLYSQDAHADAR